MAGPVRSRIRHLRLTLAASGVMLAAAAGVGALAGGGIAAVGAVAGVGLVALSYTASTLAIAWADSITPRLVFGVGIGMYIMKFTLFGIMLIALTDAGWPGRIPMAWGIVAGVIAWTASQIWWTLHHAHPYVRVPNQ